MLFRSYRHTIGIRISGKSVGYIQMTITLSIFVTEIQNLFSNSSSECLLSKTLSPLLKIAYRSKRKTSIFTPLYRHIIGIRISGNSMGYIQTTIILTIFVKEIRNLCSNSSLECLLSKILSPLLKIPYHSELIIETVTEVHS